MTASDYSDTTRQSGPGFGQMAVEHAKEFTSSTGEYVEGAGQVVLDQSSQIVERTRGAIERIIQDQPMAVALAGLAAGAAVAATFPPSQVERATLGEAGKRLTDSATGLGERLTEAASAAGERLKTAVVTDTLANVARDVAGNFGTISGSEAHADPHSRSRTEATISSSGAASPLVPHSPTSQGSSSPKGVASKTNAD
jgi:hypothetical protein